MHDVQAICGHCVRTVDVADVRTQRWRFCEHVLLRQILHLLEAQPRVQLVPCAFDLDINRNRVLASSVRRVRHVEDLVQGPARLGHGPQRVGEALRVEVQHVEDLGRACSSWPRPAACGRGSTAVAAATALSAATAVSAATAAGCIAMSARAGGRRQNVHCTNFSLEPTDPLEPEWQQVV